MKKAGKDGGKMSEIVKKIPCPDCGSSDALVVYSNGTGYCWAGCDSEGNGFKRNPEGKDIDSSEDFVEKPKTKAKLVRDLEFTTLTNRGGVSKDICQKYGYGYGDYDFYDDDTMEWETHWCHVANYYNERGQVIAQKIRNAEKDFKFIGDAGRGMLWGRHLWRNKGGRKIIVTEGEIDCLSVAHAFGGKYPVVSISTGAGTARKCLTDNLDFLESFDQVVLWFDSDEVGQKALEDCKGVFSPSKLYYIPFDSQYKDANEVLKARGVKAVVEKTYEAIEFREDGIVRGSDLSFEDMRRNIRKGRPMPYPKLQSMTMGSRDGELWIWTAGSGIGKSTMITEVAKFQLDNDDNVKLGCIYLEESKEKTYDRFVALDHDVPLKDLRLNHDLVDEEDAYDTHEKYFASNRINMYDHFGSVDTSNLLRKMRELHVSEGCDTLLLDHISIAVSGLESDEGERKMLDVFMTNMRTFIEETGCTIHAVVHLKRAKGKDFNEGASVSLTDLRGSASLEQLSDAVIAIERNQQGDDPFVARVRILKCRETGETGVADNVRYSIDTGRYSVYDGEVDEEFEPTGDGNF